MATTFQPDVVLQGDSAGFSQWLTSHYFEHLRFISIAQNKTPPYSVPDYALNAWRPERPFQIDWLSKHQSVHESLRELTGVSGVDLSVVDLSDRVAWFQWMDAHAQEHGFLRTALGAV